MARAATAPELAYLRSDNQRSKLYLSIHSPAVVYSARINQTFTSYDNVAQLTYDGGSGTLGNVLPGMTMYIGSSSGAYDKGMVRIRKTPTASIFYIGPTSGIQYADNDFLAVVNEFGLWPRHPQTTAADLVYYIDWDVAYSDQHKYFNPVAVLGPPAVLWLTGATVNITPSASASWVLGSSIAGYSWSAPGASATSGMTTATPTITYNAPGTYRVSCLVTAANGKTATGYRWVFVHSAASMPATQFTLKDCRGDFEDGGWEFEVEMLAEAGTSVRDRALVILHSQDWYGTTKISIGPVVGYENIIAYGWIDGESIDWNPEQGLVNFTVRGAAHWLGRILGSPCELKDTTTDPIAWNEISTLTVDKALHHLLYWQSTAMEVIDVTLTNDTRRVQLVSAAFDKLWDQLNSIAGKILAFPVCDRFCRLTVEIDSQMIAVADRSSIPVVQALTVLDWHDSIEIERITIPEVGQYEITGNLWDGNNLTPYYSRAAGNSPLCCGRILTLDDLIVSSQTQLNTLAGLLLGLENNEFPGVEISLASNQRLIDISPRQYVTISMAAGDTPRGLSWSNKKFIPRRVSYKHDEKTGELLTELTLEAETNPTPSVTIYRPQTPIDNTPPMPWDDGFDDLDYENNPSGGWTFPPPETLPPGIQPPTDDGCQTNMAYPENGPYLLGSTGWLTSVDEYPLRIPIFAALRSPAATHDSSYMISGLFQKRTVTTDPIGAWGSTLDDNFYNIYAIDSTMTRIATGVHDAVVGDGTVRTGKFNNVAAVEIYGIEIELVSERGTVDSVTFNYQNNSGGGSLSGQADSWYWQGGVLVVSAHVVWTNSGLPHAPAVACQIFPNISTDPLGGAWLKGWTNVLYQYEAHVDSTGSGAKLCGSYYARLFGTKVWYSGAGGSGTPLLGELDLGDCYQDIISPPFADLGNFYCAVLGIPAYWIGGYFRSEVAGGCNYSTQEFEFKFKLSKLPGYRMRLNSIQLFNLCSYVWD